MFVYSKMLVLLKSKHLKKRIIWKLYLGTKIKGQTFSKSFYNW